MWSFSKAEVPSLYFKPGFKKTPISLRDLTPISSYISGYRKVSEGAVELNLVIVSRSSLPVERKIKVYVMI